MVFLVNLEIHLNDSIRYETNINIITYLVYLGNIIGRFLSCLGSYVKVEAYITGCADL